MNTHNQEHAVREHHVFVLPKGSWKYLREIRETQKRIEDILAGNKRKFPTQTQYSPTDKYKYIRETDSLITELNEFSQLLFTARNERLGGLLAFIREGVLFYRMTDPTLLRGYRDFLIETILPQRKDQGILSLHESELLSVEIEYFSDLL